MVEQSVAARHMNGLEANGCRIPRMLCLHNRRTQCTRDRLGRIFRDMCNRYGDMRETSPWEGAPRPGIDRVGLRGTWERHSIDIQHGISMEGFAHFSNVSWPTASSMSS